MKWYLAVLKKYAVFSGRARRSEYWFFFLFNFLIALVLGLIDEAVGFSLFSLIYGLAVFVPGIAVSVRRLHDTGRSGWWLLLLLIPIVGPIVILIFMVLDSQPGDNLYGPNPKEAVDPEWTLRSGG
jgi:uncharacterized membrane protein YhaH (DUF805 family)